MRRGFAAAALFATLSVAVPANAEFRDVARALESRIGKRTWIPFLGLARGLVRVVSPRGVHDFQLAVFENARRIDGRELETLLQNHVGRGFTPLVRVRSRRESVFVYARPAGDTRLDLTILTQDGGDTVLVRVSVDGEVMAKNFSQPRRIASIAND